MATSYVYEPRTNCCLRFFSRHFSERSLKRGLESETRIELQDIVDKVWCQLLDPEPHDVYVSAHANKGHFRLFTISNTGAGVQSDRVPDKLGFGFGIAIRLQEPASRIGTINLEALSGGKFVRQAQIVEQR